MYVAYLKDSSGRYFSRIYLEENNDDVIHFILRYKSVVPFLLITSGDVIAIEIENGEFLFPENIPPEFKALEEPTIEKSFDELIFIYLKYVELYTQSKALNSEIYREMVTVENDLLALAARDNHDLYSYGWKNSGVIQAELEAANDVY